MFIQLWAGLWCPVLAGYAGYLLTHELNGVLGGVTAYTVLVLFSQATRLYDRADVWASKMAMLRAEERALQLALAAESRRAGPDAEGSSALIEAYRTRLALLEVRKTALRAGYRSYRAVGVLGHFSETKGGLLPDAG